MKTPVVVPEDNTLTITGQGNGVDFTINGGKVNYVVTASSQPYASAIIDDLFADGDTLNGIQGCIIELGEKLYDGKLQLNDSVGVYDDFGRPARKWQYDGTVFGTYAKKEQLRQQYTQKVTGKMLYDLLGSDIVNSISKQGQWGLSVTIDGETDYDVLNPYGTNAYFSEKSITRTNTDAVGDTENGTLTQVYVDSVHHQVDIAVINTYLAIAEQDYNSRDEDVDLRVYHISDDKGTPNDGRYVKFNHETQNSEEIITAHAEDFNIADVKDGDKFLVTVAQGEIQTMTAPEIISEATLNTFKKEKWVKNDDVQYDYSGTARYDVEVLDQYDQSNMKDVTYNIILDQYGYLVGIELNELVNQYLFLTGMDLGNSNLSAKNAEANVIFLDGTMKTVTVRVDKSQIAKQINGRFTITGGTDDLSKITPSPAWDTTGTQTAPTNNADPSMSQINTWCTYSVDSNGVYTLKQVGNYSKARTDATDPVKGAKKIAQSSMDMSALVIDTEKANELVISGKTVSLEGSKARNDAANGDFKYVYGNDETVYINTTLKKVDARGTDGKRAIVDKVDSVTTGVKNVDMTIKNLTNTPVSLAGSQVPKDEVYVLYKDNGYIIGVVTLGAVDNGTTSKWAYITGDVNEEGYMGNSQWKWSKNAIIDGKKVVLTEVDDNLDILHDSKTVKGNWYSLRFDADGHVVGIKDEDTGTGEDRIDFGYAPYDHDDSDGALGSDSTNDRYPDKFVTSVQEAREAYNKMGDFKEKFSTVLMMTDYTCNTAGHTTNDKREMKFEAGTLYTDRNVNNINDEGFQISPTANIVLITSKGHNDKIWNSIVDGYVGWEGMDEAIKALNSETSGGWSAFDGYLMAVFNNGIATSVILHDQSGNGKNAPTESSDAMTVNFKLMDGATQKALVTKTIKADTTFMPNTLLTEAKAAIAPATTLDSYKVANNDSIKVEYVKRNTIDIEIPLEAIAAEKMRVTVHFKAAGNVSASDPDVAPALYVEVTNKLVAGVADNKLKLATKTDSEAAADVDYVVEAPDGFLFASAQTHEEWFDATKTTEVTFAVKAAKSIKVYEMKDGLKTAVDKTVADDATYGSIITTSTSANEWFKVTTPGANPGDPDVVKYVAGNSATTVDADATIDPLDTYVKVKVAHGTVVANSTAASIVGTDITVVTSALDTTDGTPDTADTNANYFLKVGGTYKVKVTFTTVTGSPATIGATALAATAAADEGITLGADAANVTMVAAGTQLTNGDTGEISITIGGTPTANAATITVTLADKT